MGQRAFVQSDIREQLRLVYPDGTLGGKAVLALLVASVSYCSTDETETDIETWFAELESHMRYSLCEIVRPLMARWYAKDEGIRDSDQALEGEWVDANLLLATINDLINALLTYKPKMTWWYQPEDTLVDCQVFAQTLLLLIGRHAKKVRIFFQ